MTKNLVRPVLLLLLAVLIVAGAGLAIKLRPLMNLEPLPAFETQELSRADLLHETGLVNVFASWCGPCRAEHPLLVDLAQTIPVYGIAFMDRPDDLAAYLKENGNPYKKIGNDEDGAAAQAWNLVGVPATFVIHKGRILFRYDGALTDDIAASIKDALKNLD